VVVDRVARVRREVHHDLLERGSIREHVHGLARVLDADVDRLQQQATQRRRECVEQEVEIDLHHLEAALPAEAAEVTDDLGAVLGGLADAPDELVRDGAGDDTAHEQVGAREDDRQEVVEVVRDAAREVPDGLHLLRLPELRFDRALLRHVVRHGDDCPGHRQAEVGPQLGARAAARLEGDRGAGSLLRAPEVVAIDCPSAAIDLDTSDDLRALAS
jgi:hypothetical protein